jgi:hypothetical protein
VFHVAAHELFHGASEQLGGSPVCSADDSVRAGQEHGIGQILGKGKEV